MIEIKNLTKHFGDSLVLDSLNLKVETGETKVIIGRSGCGKSVMLKHIVGLLTPESGQVIVDGQDIWKLDEKKMSHLHMKIGMVFQGGALFDSLSVWENVGFVLREYSTLKESEIRKRVKEALSFVNLFDIEDKMPAELSGGMKKRVAIARALCVRPQTILYDEPTTGIDPITADAINVLIDDLHDKLKVTSIVVTHDMRSAYKVADKIAMLYNGKIIAEGTPDEIRYTHDAIVHQFITGAAHGPITGSARE
ncbi:ABC transporter ATP-binding protein [Candidatus Omnitrophota bacterium]